MRFNGNILINLPLLWVIFATEKIIEGKLKLNKSLISKGIANIITVPRRAGKSVLAFEISQNQSLGFINFNDERLS